MLWVALHLPLLSLESLSATLLGEEGGRPLALIAGHSIGSVNAAAQALGVEPGMKRATALTLAPGLVLGLADRVRDAQALTAVAYAALAFTPMVAIQPTGHAASAGAAHDTPNTVVLEVQASLRYFGGLPSLLRRLRSALAPLGHRLNIVAAGTPLGAALLARVHADLCCSDLAATGRALSRAPVWLLGPGRLHWEALQGMGLHTIDDLKRVPRDGLARRFGPVVLDELDRATGARPDPREPLALPPSFEGRLELFARADTTEQLLQGAVVLLARLVTWLSAQHALVRRFTFVMLHEKRSRHDAPGAESTRLEVSLAEPSRDSAHLLVLLRERLSQLQLPAPTLDLRLHADDIARRGPPNTELFPTPASDHEGLTRLIERLQARLGRDQVLRLMPVQDHRPERATAWCMADAGMRPTRSGPRVGSPHVRAAQARSIRPVWLFTEPEPLPEREASGECGPWYEGQPLRLLSGPERIESGWWDFEAVERDYYIAQLPHGALVWIFRERVSNAGAKLNWFVQGRFG